MYIDSIMIDDSQKENRHIKKPSNSNIESAIKNLNGGSRSIVTLNCPPENFLAVCGGEQGEYVCFVVDKNGNEFNLVDPSAPNETVEVQMGQLSIRGKNEIINIDTALTVAKKFAELGEYEDPPTPFEWDLQD